MCFKAALLCVVAASGGTAVLAQTGLPVATRLGSGYLERSDLPDSKAILPPPPVAGSKAHKRDLAGAGRAVALRDTARWKQARIDADIFVPEATSVMSCATGFRISAETTPRINALLRKAGSDLGLSSYGAKQLYSRSRPFTVNGQPVCTPDMEAVLRQDGSYPSGHAAIGYGWAMILADIVPGRKSKLLKRGRAFGDSRRVCNVHYRSDIEAGQVLARAVVARLRQVPAFRADLEAAQAEARGVHEKPQNCAVERAALKER